MALGKTLYEDIAARTGGEIYIGVVGPVRTGKSTFIKKFMDTVVLPNISDSFSRERTTDTLPQSAAGKTVMTTEPKFVPTDAVEVKLSDNTSFKVKMIDCVGYIVPGAMGLIEDGEPRMVMTPWSDSPMPFENAAEIGTKKVISEHSTIGILVTTDGSIGEIPRQAYEEVEQRVVNELKEQNKPFVIVLNSATPSDTGALSLADELENRYGVPVALVNCLELDEEDIKHILEMTLLEFPVKELIFDLPAWVGALGDEHPLRVRITEGITEKALEASKAGDINPLFDNVSEDEFGSCLHVNQVDLATGTGRIKIDVPEKLFYKILGDETGFEIDGEESLIRIMGELAEAKRKYDKFSQALNQLDETGYGIVTPSVEDLTLEEPEIVKQAGGYGVRLKASAPSIHMMCSKQKFLKPHKTGIFKAQSFLGSVLF